MSASFLSRRDLYEKRKNVVVPHPWNSGCYRNFRGGTVFAEEPAVTQLAEVVVIGDRNKEREVLPGDFVYTKSQTGF